MKAFKSNDLKLFEQIVAMRQTSLKQVMFNFLRKYYPNIISTGRYITCEGQIPIALVAHLDTVFKNPPAEIFYDQRQGVVFSPQGLGADDRAGIFAIIRIVQSGLRPHIILTTDEEYGGIGATVLGSKDCPFKDLRYIIELDRRGSDDCVFYDCSNQEFIDYVESFGFVEAFGSFTDICCLCKPWGVAGVNLSVGYRDEHTKVEVLFTNQLLATIEKVKKMLKEDKIPYFKYIPAPKAYKVLPYDGPLICKKCERFFLEEEMYPVYTQDNKQVFYCPDCLVDVASWCIKCGNAYEATKKEFNQLCPSCKKEGNPTNGTASK